MRKYKMYSIVESNGQTYHGKTYQTDFKQSVIFEMISINCEIYRLDEYRKKQLIGILNDKTYVYILFKSLKICLKDYFDKEFSEGFAESLSIIEDWLSSDGLIDSERLTRIYKKINMYTMTYDNKFFIYSSISSILGLISPKSSIDYKCAKQQFVSFQILNAANFDQKFKRKVSAFIVKFLTSGKNLFLV